MMLRFRLFSLVFLCVLGISSVAAQSSNSQAMKDSAMLYSEAEEQYPASVGGYIHSKIGLNSASIPFTRATSFSFNGIPDFGVMCFFPIHKKQQIALLGELGFTTNSYGENLDNEFSANLPNSREEYVFRHNYISGSVGVAIRSITMSMGLGLPVGGTYVNSAKGVMFSSSIPTTNLQPIIDLKLGAMFPIYYDRSGRLNLHVNGGYVMTGIYTNSLEAYQHISQEVRDATGFPANLGKEYNPMPLSISVGLSYLFTLNPSEVPIIDAK